MTLIFAATFFCLVLLRLLAVIVLGFFIIRPVSSCPACFADTTLPVRRPLVWLLGRHYEWRWCPACGWQALTSNRPLS